VIKSISDLAGTAWILRHALRKEMVPNKDSVVICLSQEDAENIYFDIMKIARNSMADQIMIPVLTRSGRSEYTTLRMDIPGVPERTGEPWMALFDIEVFVV
jgi:hypothetical protein